VPQHCEPKSGTFLLQGLTIHCDPSTDPQHENTLQILAVAVEKASGKTPEVKRDCRQLHSVVIDRRSTLAPPPSRQTRGKKESYLLSAEPERICLQGEDAAGLFYGVQTLAQVLQGAQGRSVPCLAIEDWPDMAFRGYGPFAQPKSQNPADIPAFYRNIVELLARNKLNHLAFAADVFQEDDELRKFGEFCRLNFVEPIPACEFLGIRTKYMVKYAEAADAEFKEALRPAERAIRLLNPRMFCIGGDELVSTYDHRSRKSVYTEAQRQKHAPHEWLALCLKRFHEYLKAHGVEMVMWADSLIDEDLFYGHPSMINGYGGKPDYHCRVADLLPKDIIMWDWHYESTYDYPTHSYLQSKGFRTIGCPWTALGNPELFAEYGVKTGTDKFLGMLDCEWAQTDMTFLGNAIARAGDCFWSAGRYEDSSPPFERLKKLTERNPLVDLADGDHRIVIESDAMTNSAAFLVHSIRVIHAVFRPDGMGAKTHRNVEADYLVKAAPGCVFETCQVHVGLNEAFTGAISFSATEREKDLERLVDLGGKDTATLDLTSRVKGKPLFRLSFWGYNPTKGSAAFLRRFEVTCRVVEAKR
jgi:hypothetical protein